MIQAIPGAGERHAWPMVSVVIPAYNAGRFIDEAIWSALNQTYPNIEVVVVNDGSTDDTAKKAANHGKSVRVVQRTSSGGFPGAVRNTGIAHCSGEFICFLDADDVMEADRVALQANALINDRKAGVAFIDYRNFSDSDGVFSAETHFDTCRLLRQRLNGEKAVMLPGKEASLLLLHENFGGAGLIMIRREVLDVVPGFSEEFRIGEDFCFYYRIARNFPVAVIDSVGLRRRLHGDNVTGDSLARLQNYVLTRHSLRRTESDRNNARLLDRLVAEGELELVRACGNRRDLRGALSHTLRGLAPGSTADRLGRLRCISRLWARNLAIFVGAKAPSS